MLGLQQPHLHTTQAKRHLALKQYAPKYHQKIPQLDNGRIGTLDYDGTGGESHFNGNIDEVSIWDTNLTEEEVGEIYNDGVPANLAEHSKINNLVSLWRMGDGDTFPTLTDNQGGNDGTMVNAEITDVEIDVPL